MIIGISGKIGSGKDTVGRIIQCLTAKGYSEDDVITALIKGGDYNLLPFSDETTWQVKKFADKLKQIGHIMTGYPLEDFYSEEGKKKYMPEWGMTIRKFQTSLGTDAMTSHVHPDAWVLALFSTYRKGEGYGGYNIVDNKLSPIYPNWIITDVRFPNEVKAIKEKNGIIIRVDRPVAPCKNYEELHISETALDDYPFDYRIKNDGTLEELVLKVKEVLVDLKLVTKNKQ